MLSKWQLDPMKDDCNAIPCIAVPLNHKTPCPGSLLLRALQRHDSFVLSSFPVAFHMLGAPINTINAHASYMHSQDGRVPDATLSLPEGE